MCQRPCGTHRQVRERILRALRWLSRYATDANRGLKEAYSDKEGRWPLW
jgi:histidinol-phosphate/aromatic aminotransferase/cobyric acid decarboxylase-like protein